MAARTKISKKRDRVRKDMIAREGGSRALVDFHVTPPLERSMSLGMGERERGGGASTRLRIEDLLAYCHDGEGCNCAAQMAEGAHVEGQSVYPMPVPESSKQKRFHSEDFDAKIGPKALGRNQTWYVPP